MPEPRGCTWCLDTGTCPDCAEHLSAELSGQIVARGMRICRCGHPAADHWHASPHGRMVETVCVGCDCEAFDAGEHA